MENKESEPYNFPSLLLWRIFQAMLQEGEMQAESRDFLNQRDKSESLGTPRQLKFSWKSTEEEMTVHKTFWRSADGPPEVFSLVMISVYVWGNYLKPRKEPPKRIRDNVPSPHIGLVIVPVPTIQTEKSQNSQSIVFFFKHCLLRGGELLWVFVAVRGLSLVVVSRS